MSLGHQYEWYRWASIQGRMWTNMVHNVLLVHYLVGEKGDLCSLATAHIEIVWKGPKVTNWKCTSCNGDGIKRWEPATVITAWEGGGGSHLLSEVREGHICPRCNQNHQFGHSFSTRTKIKDFRSYFYAILTDLNMCQFHFQIVSMRAARAVLFQLRCPQV